MTDLPDIDTLCTFAKTGDDDQRTVFGFASIIAKGGVPTADTQGDVILDTELIKAAHGYMLTGRGGKVGHTGSNIAEPIESIVVSKSSSFPALLQKMGIPVPNPLPMEGWWIGFRVNDPDVWERVKKGELKSFSIGGTGRRTQID
jgi:hypothetical protein